MTVALATVSKLIMPALAGGANISASPTTIMRVFFILFSLIDMNTHHQCRIVTLTG